MSPLLTGLDEGVKPKPASLLLEHTCPFFSCLHVQVLSSRESLDCKDVVGFILVSAWHFLQSSFIRNNIQGLCMHFIPGSG